MCQYLEESDNNDFYCNMAGRRVSERRATIVCGTDAFYDCSTYNVKEYDTDSGYSGRSDETEEAYEEEAEYEYAEEY